MEVPRAQQRLGQALAALGLAAAGVVMATAPALAVDGCVNEGLTSGSVDAREIRYTQSTKYSREFFQARDAWNALGRVNIAADTGTTVNDLHVSDVNRSAEGWSGLWSASAGQDDIYLNGHYLADYTYPEVRGVIAHELGHALRLGHFDNRSALMHCRDTRSPTSPASADITKYRSIWG